MTPRVALFAALSLSSACATRSPPPVEVAPALQACDPRVTAAPEPEPPVAGGIVEPATPQEREAVSTFLSVEAQARAWGREGWARAGVARSACATAGGDRPRTSPRNRPG